MGGSTHPAKQCGTAPPLVSATESRGAETQTSLRGASSVRLRDRYLQLKPLGWNEVPFHPDFGTADAVGDGGGFPNLGAFLGALVREVKEWDAAGEEWEVLGTHRFGKGQTPASTCDEVKKLARQVGRDVWFARMSKHLNQRPGTWDALDFAIRVDHAAHEAEYTPNIFDQKEILVWPSEALDGAARGLGVEGVELLGTMYYHYLWRPERDTGADC